MFPRAMLVVRLAWHVDDRLGVQWWLCRVCSLRAVCTCALLACACLCATALSVCARAHLRFCRVLRLCVPERLCVHGVSGAREEEEEEEEKKASRCVICRCVACVCACVSGV